MALYGINYMALYWHYIGTSAWYGDQHGNPARDHVSLSMANEVTRVSGAAEIGLCPIGMSQCRSNRSEEE